MTDYNDGQWHGWNGGECPVHPKTQVRVIEDSGAIWVAAARARDWQSLNGAFRVIKKYRDPRECWSYGVHLYDTLADAESFRADVDAASPGKGYGDGPITHWVEVLP